MKIYIIVFLLYKLCTTCEGNREFHEPEGLRVCSVPSVAKALRGCREGSRNSVFPEYTECITRLVQSQRTPDTGAAVSKRREFERSERERD